VRSEDLDRLEHILEAAERIAGYAEAGRRHTRQNQYVRTPSSETSRSSARLPGGSQVNCEMSTRRFRGRTSSVTATSSFTATGDSLTGSFGESSRANSRTVLLVLRPGHWASAPV
jgi:hypothetical protein